MAARKLQTEIDRTLKKVSEGVEQFESIYDKMQVSTNQTQKEKLELDLKTQIKRLQRLRDQIKTWTASNEIKDKSSLQQNRRLIETQMEKFKACEKEMKTKAFSKEGLIQAAKLDPKEQEKEEATQWLQSSVEELQMQVETSEAEIEGLQGTGKKRGKGGSAAGRLEDLEALNERRKWHISRLEIVLRMLNNGSLTPEQVMDLKDNVDYFVSENSAADFMEDEGIYDALNLDEEEEKFGIAADDDDDDSEDSDAASEDIPPRTPKKREEENGTNKRTESPILKKAAVTLQPRKSSVDSKPPPNPNFAQQPMSSILKAGLPATRPPAQLPPIRYAAAAAAAVAPPTPSVHSHPQPATQTAPAPPLGTASSSSAPALPTPIPHSQSSNSADGVTSSPSLTHPSTTSPMLSSAASVQPLDDSISGQESPVISEAPSGSVGAGVASSPPQPSGLVRKDSISSSLELAPHTNQVAVEQPLQNPHVSNGPIPTLQPQSVPPASWPSPLPQQVQQYPLTPQGNGPSIPNSHATPQYPLGVKIQKNEQSSINQQQPGAVAIGSQRPPSAAQQSSQARQGQPLGALGDLVASFENVKQKAGYRMNNLDHVHKILESGYSTVPQPLDTEKPKYYVPRNPFQTSPHYPQVPHALLNTAAIFSQLDVETLFYVFYFLPGTYQQYLAAKELKRQSWRFHVKYLTWFQRHSEPQAITEEYEQGVYVYFDWEGSWCQRKKSDFRFEYRYLSED